MHSICSCLTANTVPATTGPVHVTRGDNNLHDPKFNETFYMLVAEAELHRKVMRVDICCQSPLSSSDQYQSLVRGWSKSSIVEIV